MLTATQIDTAIKDAAHYFIPESIKKGRYVLNKAGKPFSRPGGYCRVYKYELDNGNIMALRLWTEDVPDLTRRLKAISSFLKNAKSEYFVDFDYIENGIEVNGEIYPLVLMDWCDGINLKSYVRKCIETNEISKLSELAADFFKMTQELKMLGISHGDLNHANILVTTDGNLKLIDYDSMYVPALSGYLDICDGYDGYQPVARKNNKYLQPYVDYFSEFVIFFTIYILSIKPELWDEDKADRDKIFLFDINELDGVLSKGIDSNVKSVSFWYRTFLHSDDLKNIKDLDFVIGLTKIYPKTDDGGEHNPPPPPPPPPVDISGLSGLFSKTNVNVADTPKAVVKADISALQHLFAKTNNIVNKSNKVAKPADLSGLKGLLTK